MVVTALAVGLVAVQGAAVVSGDEGDDPVGYSIGSNGKGSVRGCNVYKIDLKTGAATQVNSVGQPVGAATG